KARSRLRPPRSVPTVTTRPSRPAVPSKTENTRTGTSSVAGRSRRAEAPVSGDPRFWGQFLGHEDAGCTGRLAGNAAELAPAAPLVKARCLEADGVEHGTTTAALAPFGLGHLEDPAAEPGPAKP